MAEHGAVNSKSFVINIKADCNEVMNCIAFTLGYNVAI